LASKIEPNQINLRESYVNFYNQSAHRLTAALFLLNSSAVLAGLSYLPHAINANQELLPWVLTSFLTGTVLTFLVLLLEFGHATYFLEHLERNNYEKNNLIEKNSAFFRFKIGCASLCFWLFGISATISMLLGMGVYTLLAVFFVFCLFFRVIVFKFKKIFCL